MHFSLGETASDTNCVGLSFQVDFVLADCGYSVVGGSAEPVSDAQLGVVPLGSVLFSFLDSGSFGTSLLQGVKNVPKSDRFDSSVINLSELAFSCGIKIDHETASENGLQVN